MISEKAGLITAFSLAAYISRLCFRRPNPPPNEKHNKDSLLGRIPAMANLREYIFLGLSIAHIILTASFPPKSGLFCPKPEHLNPKYFQFSPYVITCLGAIYAAGTLRILAFQTLGKSFTFELAKPEKLVTTGVYAYMQHPSYLPDGIISIANLALFANLDGWAGTYLPRELVQLYVKAKGLCLLSAAVIWGSVMSIRIREEEEMLREIFGTEWEEWHRRTARFIPGLI
jgi:protein-S-isoprenylcysteine O-methyltransferase Ste14